MQTPTSVASEAPVTNADQDGLPPVDGLASAPPGSQDVTPEGTRRTQSHDVENMNEAIRTASLLNEGEAERRDVAGESSDESDDGEFIHTVRRSKSKQEREKAKGQKPGNQPIFKDKMGEFLEAYRPRYKAIRQLSRGKRKQLKEFWYDLQVLFWQDFGWEEVKVAIGEKAKNWGKGKVMQYANEVSNKNFRWWSVDLPVIPVYQRVVQL